MPLLEINDLTLEFGAVSESKRALDGVSLSIESGETMCLVGESGSGKSLTALSIAKLVPTPPARYVRGSILLEGRDVLTLPDRELHRLRGGLVSFVFQDPGASLNPVMPVGRQVMEVLELHRPKAATRAEVCRLLALVGIASPQERASSYPHQLSGGMQQRVMIAMALASNPKLLVADEPTTALDVTIQAQIMELLADLKQRLGMSILLITHNLGVAAALADRIVVMYAGQVVEMAPALALLSDPRHPYTRALMESAPELGVSTARLKAIPGSVPRLGAFPSGCRFHPRCSIAAPECASRDPSLEQWPDGRKVRCPFARKGDAV